MANTYSAPNFDIKSADINVAGLTALKGSACAATDIIYISEGYRVTIDSDTSCLKIYQGDNLAGTAAVKTGHLSVITSGASVTLTLYDTTLNKGLTGESTTSTITMTGESDTVRAIILGNTTDKCSSLDVAYFQWTCNWFQIEQFNQFFIANALSSFQNGVMKNCVTANRASTIMPALWNNIHSLGCDNSFRDETAGTPTDYGKFLALNEMRVTGTASGIGNFNTRFGTAGLSRYVYYRQDANSMQAVPAWTTTTGVQSLTANVNGTLTATWGAATHGTGDAVRFRIYIRAGAAPDSFGVASAYYLGETPLTTFRIGTDAAGVALVAGTTYHVICRAATAISNEDTNTTALTATALALPTGGLKHLRGGGRLS